MMRLSHGGHHLSQAPVHAARARFRSPMAPDPSCATSRPVVLSRSAKPSPKATSPQAIARRRSQPRKRGKSSTTSTATSGPLRVSDGSWSGVSGTSASTSSHAATHTSCRCCRSAAVSAIAATRAATKRRCAAPRGGRPPSSAATSSNESSAVRLTRAASTTPGSEAAARTARWLSASSGGTRARAPARPRSRPSHRTSGMTRPRRRTGMASTSSPMPNMALAATRDAPVPTSSASTQRRRRVVNRSSAAMSSSMDGTVTSVCSLRRCASQPKVLPGSSPEAPGREAVMAVQLRGLLPSDTPRIVQPVPSGLARWHGERRLGRRSSRSTVWCEVDRRATRSQRATPSPSNSPRAVGRHPALP
jgi:hypothetical protein